MIRFAIEIKTINGLEQSVESCMLEAQLQLIGLNAFNTSNSPPFITNNSPPVVLTNLAKSHCVLYWAHKDDGWGYVIRKKSATAFLPPSTLPCRSRIKMLFRQIFHAP
mmetsp:Transcript_25465/g.48241  ORF Transcript_25465/g.48241 Transcript_25465/m.48241 type:complete len:108 (-) Transcript_25465:184-507(-)